jgi:hypothetical protein
MMSIFNILKIAGKAGCEVLHYDSSLGFRLSAIKLRFSFCRRGTTGHAAASRKYRDERTATTHLWRHGRCGGNPDEKM